MRHSAQSLYKDPKWALEQNQDWFWYNNQEWFDQGEVRLRFHAWWIYSG